MFEIIKKIVQKIKKIVFVKKFYHSIYCYIFMKDVARIHTHLTMEEKFFLYKKIPEKALCVEIGSYLGASSLCIASSSNCQKIFCVDTWHNEGMAEGQKDTYQDFLYNTRSFAHKIFPLRGKSAEIGNSFHEKIDFLFIDGDHSYDGVKQDIKIWLPKLRSRGVIIMHDCGWAEGVQRDRKSVV